MWKIKKVGLLIIFIIFKWVHIIYNVLFLKNVSYISHKRKVHAYTYIWTPYLGIWKLVFQDIGRSWTRISIFQNYEINKWKQEKCVVQKLSTVDLFFMIYKLRRQIVKMQAEWKAYNSIKLYTNNFRDFIFYISMIFQSSFLEDLAKPRNNNLKL